MRPSKILTCPCGESCSCRNASGPNIRSFARLSCPIAQIRSGKPVASLPSCEVASHTVPVEEVDHVGAEHDLSSGWQQDQETTSGASVCRSAFGGGAAAPAMAATDAARPDLRASQRTSISSGCGWVSDRPQRSGHECSGSANRRPGVGQSGGENGSADSGQDRGGVRRDQLGAFERVGDYRDEGRFDRTADVVGLLRKTHACEAISIRREKGHRRAPVILPVLRRVLSSENTPSVVYTDGQFSKNQRFADIVCRLGDWRKGPFEGDSLKANRARGDGGSRMLRAETRQAQQQGVEAIRGCSAESRGCIRRSQNSKVRRDRCASHGSACREMAVSIARSVLLARPDSVRGVCRISNVRRRELDPGKDRSLQIRCLLGLALSSRRREQCSRLRSSQSARLAALRGQQRHAFGLSQDSCADAEVAQRLGSIFFRVVWPSGTHIPCHEATEFGHKDFRSKLETHRSRRRSGSSNPTQRRHGRCDRAPQVRGKLVESGSAQIRESGVLSSQRYSESLHPSSCGSDNCVKTLHQHSGESVAIDAGPDGLMADAGRGCDSSQPVAGVTGKGDRAGDCAPEYCALGIASAACSAVSPMPGEKTGRIASLFVAYRLDFASGRIISIEINTAASRRMGLRPAGTSRSRHVGSAAPLPCPVATTHQSGSSQSLAALPTFESRRCEPGQMASPEFRGQGGHFVKVVRARRATGALRVFSG